MRISDWSSDVCSSDLRLNRGLKAFIKGDKFDATTLLRVPGTRNHKYPGSPIVRVERYADARHKPENLAKFLGTPSDVSTHTNATEGVVLPEVPKGFTGRGKKEYEWMRKEIGRQAGRERGCQYV